MTFKEVLQKDIKSVFLNFNEFGEYHKINGKNVLIIIDENELTEREKRVRNNENGQKGLYRRQLLFYVSAEDFGKLPSPGNVLTLDDRKYRITDAQDEGGIYSISLEVYGS